jgi:hypothetical protein
VRARLSGLVLGLGVLLAGPASAQTGPRVVVRAETRIELRVERDPDAAPHLVGTLRDELGAPLDGRPIDVSVWSDEAGESGGRWTAHPRTDGGGGFDVLLGSAASGWWASASFLGDELHIGTEARQRIDLELAHVSLTLHLADRGVLDLDRPQHEVRVTASSVAGGAGLLISLRNELGVVLAEGRTDEAADLVLAVASDRLGPASAGRLIALSAPDARRSAAQAEVPIVRRRPTTLTLTRAEGDDGAERASLSGALRDAEGPRAREAVALFARPERHLGTALTDEAGRFHFDLTAAAVSGLGAEIALVARFESDAPWIGASESAPVWWSLRPPLAGGSVVLGAISLLLVLAALGLLSRRPGAAASRAAEPGRTSLELGERTRERLTEISGGVRDARTGNTVAARVEVAGQVQVTDADGRFLLHPAPGRHRFLLRAEGYAPLEAEVTVPHRGEHRGMRVRLWAMRDLALAPLRPIALALLPSADLWSLWTQRELLAALRKAGREPPELADLIERVERACYDEAPPAEEELAAIRETARRVEAALAAAKAGAPAAAGVR